MKPGSYVEIKTKTGEILKGIVMNTNDPKILSLKLDSGYNIGLDKKNILYMNELRKNQEIKPKQQEEIKINKNLKTIAILHTGGTVASKVSYATGAVFPSFSPTELINMFPELKTIANIKSRLIGNMFSEDIRFVHYNIIAKEIEKEIKAGVDGIIITHGTDTLAFTSLALSFTLENLNKPVILVGAQRSSDRPSTDAAMNLICAAQFITRSNFNEVGICMHGKSGDDFCYILPACKTKKLHTSRRDAFKAVNSNPIAKINKEGKIEFFQEYHKKEHKDKLKLKLFNDKLKLGILKAHPNLSKEEVKMFSKFNGLIIEGTGLGHLPINKIDKNTKENELILKELNKLAKKIPVVMTSQCIFGRVNMNVYDTGRKLQDSGVLGNYSDMTLEAAFIKLAWLLSNYKKNQIKDLINNNFRGEISKRVTYEENLFRLFKVF
ncbi:Glu-tRNA(Gln) amidotransferase subunit GatD [Candidatus Woesearchaeota archaeon]|nr:Glu-tRNA(Gln) amidotransferase subunit GatD [Candidatus Woesearchaeota archaeon]